MTENYTLLFGDGLSYMEEFPDCSIDMIYADLPYGTTKCKCDAISVCEVETGEDYPGICWD